MTIHELKVSLSDLLSIIELYEEEDIYELMIFWKKHLIVHHNIKKAKKNNFCYFLKDTPFFLKSWLLFLYIFIYVMAIIGLYKLSIILGRNEPLYILIPLFILMTLLYVHKSKIIVERYRSIIKYNLLELNKLSSKYDNYKI